MAYHASPPRRVPDWSKSAVAAAETVPTTAAGFTNLEASHVTHDGGFAHGVFAILPDKHYYDRLRFTFGQPTLGGTVTDATIAIYARHADGYVSLLGRSVLAADGTLPDIEAQNYQALYYAVVESIAGTSPTITVEVFVQGEHQGYLN